MREKEEKVTLSNLLNVAVNAGGIPSYKAMGFKVDSAINSMAKEAESIIQYHIGDELRASKEKLNTGIEQVRNPFVEQFSALSEEEQSQQQAEFDQKLSKAIANDETFQALRKEVIAEQKALWEKVVKREIDPIEIEGKEYAEKFQGDPRTVVVMDVKYTIDGYQALLDLISSGFIKVQ